MKIRLRHSARWSRDLAPSDRRLWLLWSIGWRVEVRRDPVWDFVVYWRRLAVFTLALTVCGYLGAVTALHWWWGRQPEARVRWIDIALAPVRWDEFRRTRGEVAVAVGLKQLEEGNFAGAVFNLRAGLGRSPRNVPARVALARIMARNPTEAVRVLDAGLALEPNHPEFLRALFAVYEASDARTTALARADQLLDPAAKPPVSPEIKRMAQLVRATVQAKANRFEEALAAMPEIDPASSRTEDVGALRLRITLLSRLERHDEARQLFEACRRATPQDLTWHEVDLEIAVAAGDESAAQSATRRMKVARPGEVQPLLLEYEAWHRLKRPSRSSATENEIYASFGASDRAMQEFGSLLVRLDQLDVLRRVQAKAQARGLSGFAFEVDQTELAIRQGDFAEALRLLGRWEGRMAALDVNQRAVPTLIARLARCCAQGGADQATSLVTHLEKNPVLITPARCQWVVERLEAAGRYNAAGALLTLALARFPLADKLKEQNFRVALVLAREKPATDSSSESKVTDAVPSTGAQALLIIDQDIAAGKYADATEKMHRWKPARPAWWTETERELEVRELHIALLSQDPWLARFAVRKHLERSRRGDVAVRLVELAMTLRVAGKSAESDIVRGEVAELRGNIPAVAEALAKLNSGDATAAAFTSAPAALSLIDQALERRDPENALWLIEKVRRATPEWLKDVELDLATREVRGRLESEQRARAYASLRELVVKSGAPRAAAFRLVRDYISAGKAQLALELAKEIERLVPGEPAVAVLVREAEAAAPAK